MKCGESDERNEEFRANFSEEKFFHRLISTPAPVILDVGAHTGESAVMFHAIFPAATVYSIEPDPASFAELQRTMPGGSFAFNLAVASKTGTAKFFQYGKSHLNSLYPINPSSVDSLGYAQSVQGSEIDVECVTLDDLVSRLKIGDRRVDLLKIDAQGAEADILAGAQQMLHRVDGITLEINFFDFYSKRSSFLEIEQLLPGFSLYAITKTSQNPKNFRTDWAEVYYTRPEVPALEASASAAHLSTSRA